MVILSLYQRYLGQACESSNTAPNQGYIILTLGLNANHPSLLQLLQACLYPYYRLHAFGLEVKGSSGLHDLPAVVPGFLWTLLGGKKKHLTPLTHHFQAKDSLNPDTEAFFFSISFLKCYTYIIKQNI